MVSLVVRYSPQYILNKTSCPVSVWEVLAVARRPKPSTGVAISNVIFQSIFHGLTVAQVLNARLLHAQPEAKSLEV